MLEVACASHEHADTEFVCLDYAVVVADTTAWLNDSGYTILSSQCYSIIEWQEAIRSEDKTFGHTSSVCLLHSDLSTTYAVHLTCTHAECLAVLHYHDSVRLDMLNDVCNCYLIK